MGDFNADVSDPSMTSFCTLFKLKSIAKETTCYKNSRDQAFLQRSRLRNEDLKAKTRAARIA